MLAWTGLEERQPSAESTIETSENGVEYYVPHKHIPPRQWISCSGFSCITGCSQYYGELWGTVKGPDSGITGAIEAIPRHGYTPK